MHYRVSCTKNAKCKHECQWGEQGHFFKKVNHQVLLIIFYKFTLGVLIIII